MDIPADFETAIKASGFGRFNILLLIVAVPGLISTVFETTVISYILPSAECDLNLDLVDKGILNGITYCGTVVSAVGWGYLADTRGRKKLLIYGFLLDFVCVLGGAMSQSRIQLMVAKFFGGFIICGPYATVVSYLSEFHGSNRRSQIMMIIGVMFMIANILLPVLASTIIPNDWNLQIVNMKFVAWKVFLAVSGIPSLLCGILLCFFPESPRFLMSQGRNSEAMEVFKMIYALNSNKPKDTYPIKNLVEEMAQKNNCKEDKLCCVTTVKSALKEKTNLTPQPQPNTFRLLFSKPHLGLCLMVCLMQFFVLLGLSTVSLWLPQLFASLHEYEHISSGITSMCTILEYSVNKTGIVEKPANECIVIITPSSYTNNFIVATVGLVTYLIAGAVINAIGNKRMQIISLIIAGTCGLALYWSSSVVSTLIMSSLYVALGSLANTSGMGTSVGLFPTPLRTMIVSVAMMLSRIGSILGNVLFPIFMSLGCIPPFVMVGTVMFLGCVLSILLPNTNKLQLK